VGYNQPYRDDENSSRTPLSADATFTGEWTYCAHHNTVMAACKADVAGTLYMEFGSTGSGAAESTLTYTIPAGINQVHRLAVTRPYYRVKYTNGSTGQTTFDLQTMFGDFGILSAPLNLSLNQYSDAITVRAVSSEIDIAAGRFGGFQYFDKFGTNPDIDSGPEDIWEGGGLYTGFPTDQARTLEIFSSSTNDDEGGTGAEKIIVFGLDSNWEEAQEEFTLDGTSTVTSTSTWWRVNRAIVTQSNNGANTTFNDGNITIRHATTGNVLVFLTAGYNQTRQLVYTVPAGKTLYATQAFVSILKSNNSVGRMLLWYRPFGGTPRLVREFSVSNSDSFNVTIPGGVPLTEKTDVSLRCQSVTSTNTEINGFLEGVLVDNT